MDVDTGEKVIKPLTDINERLMELAGMGKMSATSYMISVFNMNSQLQGDFPPNSIYATVISDRKQFAPFYINRFRIIGLVDSGADMSCIQEGLLKRILPKHKWKLDQSRELVSASGDIMKSLGNLDVDIFLSPHSKPLHTTVCLSLIHI